MHAPPSNGRNKVDIDNDIDNINKQFKGALAAPIVYRVTWFCKSVAKNLYGTAPCFNQFLQSFSIKLCRICYKTECVGNCTA